MKSHRTTMTFHTKERMAFVNITRRVEEESGRAASRKASVS